jgi:hypothetical protein
VVVSYEDTLETVEIQPIGFEDFLYAANPDSGVNHHSALIPKKKTAVAAAAGRKTQKTYHCFSSVQ